jgi:hypothetical protein
LTTISPAQPASPAASTRRPADRQDTTAVISRLREAASALADITDYLGRLVLTPAQYALLAQQLTTVEAGASHAREAATAATVPA